MKLNLKEEEEEIGYLGQITTLESQKTFVQLHFHQDYLSEPVCSSVKWGQKCPGSQCCDDGRLMATLASCRGRVASEWGFFRLQLPC